MRSGFSFNGKHTGEFEGVTVKTKDRPVFPPVKEAVYSAESMNGEYDFSDIMGHEYYDTRKFLMEFAVMAPNLRELQKRLTALSRFFKGRGALIFDDIPTVKWNVRVIDSVSYMPENGGHSAVLSVSYKAMPFSELLWDIIEGPCLDSDIEIDSNYPLDAQEFFTLSGAGTYTNIPNVGDVDVAPVITVTGAKSPFTIGCNGKNITVKHSGDFVIDCGRELVLTGDTSLMKYVSGDFFELAPGTDNTFTITGGTVQINYTPSFLYDADFDGTDWGDGNDDEAA